MRLSVLSCLILLSILFFCNALTNCQQNLSNTNNQNKLILRIPIPQSSIEPALPKDPETFPKEPSPSDVSVTTGQIASDAPVITGPVAAPLPSSVPISTATLYVAPSATTLSPATIVVYATRGYGIEILVNDEIPLREYSEPYETSKEQITTKPSFIQDIHTSKCYESDRTVFVAVPRPGMKFTIKLWADSATGKTYRVRVFIDGTWDHASYTLTSTHSIRIEYFIDENDKKKYNFIFASSMWTDDESKVNIKENNIHGFGSIIVEFYEAVWTLKELNENPTYTVVTKSNVSNGLSYHTQFEEAPLAEEETPLMKRVKDLNDVGSSSYYGWKSADKPSAVLTMHYRPKMWLKLRGLTPDPFYARFSPGLSSESENGDGEDRYVRESRSEIERIREKLRKLSRTRAHDYFDDDDYDDDDVSNRKRRRRIEFKERSKRAHNSKSADNNHKTNRLTANNHIRSTENCNGKKVDNSRKSRSVSSTPKVKFTRYFEEIIEEAKFIDIEVGSNKPTEETIQNKKIREIIEILDSDDEA